jgi:hypothetical protein
MPPTLFPVCQDTQSGVVLIINSQLHGVVLPLAQ